MKVRKSSKQVSPYAGISFVMNEIEKAGVSQLIDSAFPKRHGKAKYGYADAILALIAGTMCGATRLDDFANLKHKIYDSSLSIPCPTSLGRIMRHKLSVSNQTVGKHEINVNMPLNSLLLDVALELGRLKAGKSYVLDYDNTCLHCEKADAELTYKKERGYQPGVSFIGELPVFIEGMNGKNPAVFDQKNTLTRTLDSLATKGIGVRRFRADAASYQSSVLKLMKERKIEIFIRAENNRDLMDYIKHQSPSQWKPVRLGMDQFDICSFEYPPFFKSHGSSKNQKTYRIVTTRRLNYNGELHKVTGQPYVYRSVITDNRTLADEDVVWTYNQRGAIELNFSVLNSDWSWARLPFSYLAENTAFMIITAIGLVMYTYVRDAFADRVDFVEETDRLKRFRHNVIAVAGEWRKDDTLLLYDASRSWEKLVG